MIEKMIRREAWNILAIPSAIQTRIRTMEDKPDTYDGNYTKPLCVDTEIP